MVVDAAKAGVSKAGINNPGLAPAKSATHEMLDTVPLRSPVENPSTG